MDEAMAKLDVGDDAGDEWEEGAGGPFVEALPPSLIYREALERYDGARLHAMAKQLGMIEFPSRAGKLAGAVADFLGEARVIDRAFATLEMPARQAISCFALSESAVWPLEAIEHTLQILGVDPATGLIPLLEAGLLAVGKEELTLVNDFPRLLQYTPERPKSRTLVAHPAAISAARTVLPKVEGASLPPAGEVRQIRESDGLEPILRLAVIWQRVSEAPLRQTQTGTFYKRDRERIEDDPVLAGPIADAIEPLPDMPSFWLAIARGVGLLESEPGSDRVKAASPDYWTDNAIHLAQMIAGCWMGLRNWHEQGGIQREGAEARLALPFARPAVLLWLATLAEHDWVAIEDLAAFLRARSSTWDRPAFLPSPTLPNQGGSPGRPKAAKPKRPEARVEQRDVGPLEALLLGPCYQLGLVRTAEESLGQRRVVQLTPLGRYALSIGSPPPPKPTYEHFLFVQPSFEVIAYRQGLTPSLIGRFSRFAVWSAIGAALALKLTPESVYRGLEGGLKPQAMLDILAKHCSRPLPAGVAEALKTWAGRRERVTYYGSATLVEFATPEELAAALRLWPEDQRTPPVAITDRLLLVEDESTIPFARFRMTGSRDYRRPPEICVEVESEGIRLSLDLARSDLLVDAELSRFADELPTEPARGSSSPRRRFLVSSESLARGVESGLNTHQLSLWFERRTGTDAPPAIRLLLLAKESRIPALSATRPLVVNTPTSEILDGLSQHPDTRDLLGKRLGPTSVVIPEDRLARFRLSLERLGLNLDDTGSTSSGSS